MQVVYLSPSQNKELRQIIQLEYTREETNTFINTVATIANNPLLIPVMCDTIVDTVNTVFIDNLINIVKNKNPIVLIAGMQNGNLGLMLDIGRRHYVELVSEVFSTVAENHDVEKDIIRSLSSYINYLYMNNKEEMDRALLELYETIYSNLGHMEIAQHRVTFVENIRPAIILIGAQHATHNANAQHC